MNIRAAMRDLFTRATSADLDAFAADRGYGIDPDLPAEEKRALIKAALVGTGKRDTLPGGLAVRECSPGTLLAHHEVPPGLVGCCVRVGWREGDRVSVLIEGEGELWFFSIEAIALDLTHETGRQHAALYCFENGSEHRSPPGYITLYNAASGRPCDVEQLRELVQEAAERVEVAKADEVTFSPPGHTRGSVDNIVPALTADMGRLEALAAVVAWKVSR